MNKQNAGVPITIAAVIGMALWFAVSLAAGRREAWDSGVYWLVAYPVAMGACAVLGFVFPHRPWRWAVVLFLFQFVAMVLRNGELGSLWPLGLVLFVVLSLPAILAARFGSRFKARQVN